MSQPNLEKSQQILYLYFDGICVFMCQLYKFIDTDVKLPDQQLCLLGETHFDFCKVTNNKISLAQTYYNHINFIFVNYI